jgi:hypothetical protein
MNSNGKQRAALSDIIDAIIRRIEGALEPSQYSQLFDSDIVSTVIKWRKDGILEPWQYSQLFDFANVALAMLHRKCSCANTYDCDSCFEYWTQLPYEREVENENR